MKEIKQIITNLEKLAKSDSKKTREEVARICSNFINEKFEEYEKLSTDIQDVVDDLSVMDEVNENGRIRKEPKIFHMKQREIKILFEKLRRNNKI